MQLTTLRRRVLAAGFVSVVLATSAGLAAATPAVAAEKRVPAKVVPRLSWGSCGAGREAFQCTSAEVPLDYDHPYGRTTTIAMTRLPATDPAHRIGSLFVNPGGPGGSGVDFIQDYAAVIPPGVRARFDIIGFDPRGVARSDSATCYDTAEEEEAAIADFPPFPVTDAEERAYDVKAKSIAESCARTSPARFRHLSTANVARDLDLLRRAVGDRKLTYAGLSYGTFLGATYAKLFPNRVRALALDGTLDPREYVGRAARFAGEPLGARIEQTRSGSEVFGEFLRQCKAAGPSRCSLAALGDPAAVTRRVFDRLLQHPVELPLPDGRTMLVTYPVAVRDAYSQLYEPSNWSYLADLFTGIAVRDRAAAGRAVSGLVATGGLDRGAQRGEDYASFGNGLSTCVDTVTPPPSVYPGVADQQDRLFPDFGRYRTWADLPCHYLEAAGIRDRDAYLGPWRQTTPARVMVFGTRWDPATAYSNTRPYANLFPHATVVTLNGWGHVALPRSRCVLALWQSYLLDPDKVYPDTTCPTDDVPFPPVTTTTATTKPASPRVPPLLR